MAAGSGRRLPSVAPTSTARSARWPPPSSSTRAFRTAAPRSSMWGTSCRRRRPGSTRRPCSTRSRDDRMQFVAAHEHPTYAPRSKEQRCQSRSRRRVVEQITYPRLRGLLDAGAQLVEVLVEDEYADEHPPGAINIPLRKLDAATTAHLDKTKAVVVYCYDGL